MLSSCKVTARVHPVHLTNVGQPQVAADLQTKPTDLGCKFACRLQAQHPPSPFIITVASNVASHVVCMYNMMLMV